MPKGAFAVCHTTCFSSAFLMAAPCVFKATSLITSYITLHFSSFVAIPFVTRQGKLSHPHCTPHKVCTCLSTKPRTHWVSFRSITSYILFSTLKSTRCPLLCARLCSLKKASCLSRFLACPQCFPSKNTRQTLVSRHSCLSHFVLLSQDLFRHSRVNVHSFFIPIALGGEQKHRKK